MTASTLDVKNPREVQMNTTKAPEIRIRNLSAGSNAPPKITLMISKRRRKKT